MQNATARQLTQQMLYLSKWSRFSNALLSQLPCAGGLCRYENQLANSLSIRRQPGCGLVLHN